MLNNIEDTKQRESAGGVVVNGEGKLALVEQHGNSWSFPKGGVEPGETHLAAALREIAEETGLGGLTFAGELGSYTRRSIGLDGTGENMNWPATTRTFFLFTTGATQLATPHDPHGEITRARFVSIDEALALLAHPADREFLKSHIGKINAILK